jgi:hypothetical protein
MKISTLEGLRACLLGCLEWTRGCNNSGYGTASFEGVTVVAHRLAAYLAGKLDTALAPTNRKGTGFVMHSCDNRRCCNPDHLEVGTYSQNQRDAYARGRRAQPKGSHHANAKLTPDQVIQIRQQYDGKLKIQTQLATEYGVSQHAISLVVLRRTYKEVE